MADPQVEHAAEVLRELEIEGLCRIIIRSPFGFLRGDFLRFVVDHRSEKTAAVLEGHHLSREELKGVSDEVATVLSAVINDTGPNRYAEARASSRQRYDEPAQDADTDRENYVAVEARFDIRALRDRAWIKKTSKNDLPLDIEWEVSTKHADDTIPPPSSNGVRYATVRFSSTPVRSTPFGPSGDDLVVLADKEDVTAMLESLTQLRAALEDRSHGETVP